MQWSDTLRFVQTSFINCCEEQKERSSEGQRNLPIVCPPISFSISFKCLSIDSQEETESNIGARIVVIIEMGFNANLFVLLTAKVDPFVRDRTFGEMMQLLGDK